MSDGVEDPALEVAWAKRIQADYALQRATAAYETARDLFQTVSTRFRLIDREWAELRARSGHDEVTKAIDAVTSREKWEL